MQKNIKEQVQAFSTTIAKDITEDITKNTTETCLKEELIRLNWELLQLQNLEVKGLITDAESDRKKVVQNKILVSSKALSKLKNGQVNEQRRSKIIWSVKTLDQLHAVLEQINYKISRSATYLRLLPKRFNTKEGKRHIKTVSVKLLRLQNTARKRHKNTYFCASLVRNIKEIVSLLESQSVLIIFQDNKARIPLGLAIANKQAPILMRVEYRVELPDHNWIIAKKHKLILFDYAILKMQNNKYRNTEAITYSGSTFIRIRSGKPDTSTAYIHSKNFDNLMSNERLYNFTITEDGQSKPVVLMLTDGSPDENSRYKKTI
ncbi:35170_t:CDS:2 [Gigaspora margarita]|uniref:35170_t:CDS:1 n=1 Tax=Gigaspora margarita TaxID=4874 RepID=A0ABN7V6E5_GIGMA|nr:35170_t:CDS:2 [Gigaspora margarita]